jgi:hypothetical protein
MVNARREKNMLTIADVYAKIEHGDYQSRLPTARYPVRPFDRRMVGELSVAELEQAATLLGAYQAAHTVCKAINKLYDEDQGMYLAQFWQDLAEATDTSKHPKRTKLVCMAYERGHSGGLSDIVSAYLDYVELLQ